MRFFNDIVITVALLISITALFGTLQRYLQFRTQHFRELAYGLFFATLSVIGMSFPVPLSSGIIIDFRTLVVAFSAIFGGFYSCLITGLCSILYRAYLGGVGAIPGIAVILLSVPVGFIFRFLHIREKIKNRVLFLALLGAASAGVWGLVLPLFPVSGTPLFMALKGEVYWPIFLLSPFISIFLGFLLMREIRQFSIEEDLKARIKLKKMVLAVSNDGFFDFDVLTGQVYFDPNYYTLAGYEPGEFSMEFDSWYNRIHPEDQHRIAKKMRLFSEGVERDYDEEFRFLRKDESWMWIRAKAITTERDDEGNPLKIMGTHRDIDKFKKIQQELNRLYMAIEQAAEVIMITDDRGYIQYVNPSFFALTGYSREETLGQNVSFLKSGDHDSEFYNKFWMTISAGEVWKGQFRNRRKDGTLLIEETVISPIREEGEKISAYVAIRKDITGDIDFQDQIAHSQKMQAVGQLAGGVAHDFNNMLTGIMTASLMLKKQVSDDEKLMKYISIIDQAVERSADLTKNLLNFSRKQPLALNIIDLHNCILNAVKLLNSTTDKRISISAVLCEGSSTIIGDKSQIENSILNLGINASHAIEGEGSIRIKTDRVFFDKRDCEENVFEIEPGKYIHLSIIDDGCGMDAITVNKVFEPFFTTKIKSKGTGLGLSSVYATIKQHKGSLTVSSEVGRGTEFHLFFPMVDESDLLVKKRDTKRKFSKRRGMHTPC